MVVSTILLYHVYGGWFADGWLHIIIVIIIAHGAVTTMELGLSRGPGVEVDGEGGPGGLVLVAEWKSKRRGRRRAEWSRSGEGIAVLRSLDDRLSQRTHAENLSFLDVARRC